MRRSSIAQLFLFCLPLVASAADKLVPDLVVDWSKTGFANIGWGEAAASAGDVNGDGYSDILIGAPLYSFGQLQEGLVYLHYGSASGLSSSAGWSMQSNRAGAQFGWSLAPAGDVNGDGYGDFVVGAPGDSNGQTEEGRVYVFAGGANGPSLLITFELNEVGARFGHCVAWAGDVNGDGYDEILAGAPEWGGYGSPFYIPVQGSVALYYGGPNGPQSSGAWGPRGGQEDADFGYSVAGLGDINKDGYGDVLVGQPLYDPGLLDSNHGKVLLYLGSASGLSSTAAWEYQGNIANARLGIRVAWAGDVNGDDHADALVSVPGYSSSTGIVRYFEGSSVGSLFPGGTLHGQTQNFGLSVAGMGDYDGDGLCDLIMGGGANADVSIVDGHMDYPQIIHGIGGTGSFGKVLASAGDVNGDGLSDWMISDPGANSGTGQLDVYHGTNGFALSNVPSHTVLGTDSGALLGHSVSGVGDPNGDGDDDLIVGAPGGGAIGGGRIELYNGTVQIPLGAPVWSYDGTNPGGRFGEAVAGAGDLNGDGYGDIVVGEPGVATVHVFYGGPTLSSTPDFSYTYPEPGCDFGASVDGAGDMNGDGYADIVIGAPGYDGTGGYVDRGLVCVLYGGPWGVTTAGGLCRLQFESHMFLGHSVAGVGDGNGDGYDDIAVGAPGYDLGLPDRGGLFVYFGDAEGMLEIAFGTSGSQAGDELGASVAAAGDINGDGFADLIVGAPGRDAAGPDAGYVQVMLGSDDAVPYLDYYTVISMTHLGGERFGQSVANAGDLGGNGFTEVVVASKDLATGNGRIDYYGLRYGGLWHLRTQLTGRPSLGVNVGELGDFDGDGYPETVVGGPGAQLFGEGAFFVFSAHAIQSPIVPARWPRLSGLDYQPLALRGRVSGSNDLMLQMRGWLPHGNARLRLEWQIAPEHQPFAAIHKSAWVPTDMQPGMRSVAFEVPHTQPLAFGERYRWRMRVASSVPFLPHGRWVTHAPNSSTLYGFAVFDPTVSVDETPVPLSALQMREPYPNPFNPSTTIRFELPEPMQVSLRIVDVAGRIVRTLEHGELAAGEHLLRWDGRDDAGSGVASGAYFAVLQAGGHTQSRKLTLLK